MMASIRNDRRFLAYALQQAENTARQAFGVCELNARKIWIISCVIFLQLCILFYRRYDSTAGFLAVGERAASSEGVQEVGGKKDAVKNDERGAELGII